MCPAIPSSSVTSDKSLILMHQAIPALFATIDETLRRNVPHLRSELHEFLEADVGHDALLEL